MHYRAYLMRLKKDRVNDYIEVHRKDKIWKSTIEGLNKSGIDKMIIFILGESVILFEEAEDLKKAYDYLAKDEPSQRWDRMCADMMESFPDYVSGKDSPFDEIPIVFYYDHGIMLH